jgi:hypothetical protein
VSRYRSCTWKPLANRSTKALQKDILCWHTMVSTSMAGTWGYFNTGAGGRGVYSHGLLGGGWGPDLRDGLDGVCWQAQDTDLRAASNLDGNWHVIAFETADNAARPIQPWTPKQCVKIVEVCVEANQVDGIPLQIIPDSKVGRRGVGYHRLGCDPYRVAGGELWTSLVRQGLPDRRPDPAAARRWSTRPASSPRAATPRPSPMSWRSSWLCTRAQPITRPPCGRQPPMVSGTR